MLIKLDLLNSGELDDNNQLVETTYVASFSQQSGNFKEPNSECLILNYLGDLLKGGSIFSREVHKCCCNNADKLFVWFRYYKDKLDKFVKGSEVRITGAGAKVFFFIIFIRHIIFIGMIK